MPRRSTPDPLAQAVGARIRKIRREKGMTMEAVAYEGELRSKGFLSDIERGLALPSLTSLKHIAEALEVPLVDLVTFPEQDERQEFIDLTRQISSETLRRWRRVAKKA